MQTGGPKALGFAGCGRHRVACIAAQWHATEWDSSEVAAWMGRQWVNA